MKHNFMAGKEGKNYSISFIRLIALLMIISCHIMQYLGMELAFWFNVGVQVFLSISGYLYGQKKAGTIRDFYIRRFRKILIPYYILIIPALILFFIFAPAEISVNKAIKVLILNETLRGGRASLVCSNNTFLLPD